MKIAAIILLSSLWSSAQEQQPITPAPAPKDAEALAVMNEKLDKLLKAKEEKERATAQKRKDLVEKQPKAFRKLILKGEICLGMNQVQVGLSLGKPEDVNRTTHRGGVHEQWVYPKGFYVYFQNGRVTAIQD